MSAPPDFRLLFESVPAAVMVLAPDSPRFTILAVSDTYLRTTGKRRIEIVGHSVFEVFPENPDQPSKVDAVSRACLEQVLQHRLPCTQPLRRTSVKRPNSEDASFEERYWRTHDISVQDESGNVRYIIHHVEDVTELAQIKRHVEKEEAIQDDSALIMREPDIRSERWRRYASFFDVSPFALALIRMPGETIVEVNDSFLKLFECSRDAVTGKTIADSGIIDTESQVRMRKELQLHGSVRNIEITGKTMNDRPHTFSLNLDWGKVDGERLLLGSFVDITENKQAEEALRESEARLRAAMASIVDEVWFTDAQGNIILTNDAAVRNLGIDKRNEFFKDIQQAAAELEIYEPDGSPRPSEHAPLLKALRGEVIQGLEELVRNARTGQLRHREVSSAPVRDEKGRIVGAVAVVRDVTESMKFLRDLRASEERYRALFKSIEEGFCIVELQFDDADRPIDFRFVVTNPAFEKQAGLRSAVGKWMRELAPDHEEFWFETLGKVALTGESVRLQDYARALERYFDVYAFRIGDPAEKLVAVLFSDITERKQTEEELKLAATVFESSSEAIVITDADTRIVAVNPAFEAITGYSSAEVIGKNPSILKSGHHDHDFYRAFWQELKTTGSWKGEFWNRSKKGDIFIVLTAINTTWNPDGSVQRRVAVITDITEKKKSDELVWQQANFDPLTGLPNRRLFQDHLQHDMKKSKRSRLPLALMFMDLDGFKDVNDALGHEAGDLLLKETGQRILSCVRETDTVARLGGDEFTVILTELTNLRQVSTIAQQILQGLSEPYQIGDGVAHISGSIGITLFPQDASNMDELLINADQAMYAAKAAGKNRYSFFTEAMQQAAQERNWLVNELRNAIENQQFKLVYQPIVELASGCINKAEALLRWEHPERGLIEPSVFIPIAEETGMISSIGNWVFVEAANQAAHWRKDFHPDFQISINKSPVQFKSRSGDISSLLEHLKRLNLPGQSIAIEITEGVLMDESQIVTDQLLALRDAGIEVSLDDFGTGYSTLSYLKRFDIDRLKIDQIFIRNLETDPDDLALCEAIIVMGHKLGIKIIAEGVETIQQQKILVNAGCDFLQGYLLSGPLSADELGGLLQKGSLYCPGPSIH